jgi:hypothetical protein
MPRVQAFEIDGLDLWFPSNDHEPSHFHAKRSGEWEVRVHFLMNDREMIEVKWLKSSKMRVSKQDKQEIIELVNAHRHQLLQEWERIHP